MTQAWRQERKKFTVGGGTRLYVSKTEVREATDAGVIGAIADLHPGQQPTADFRGQLLVQQPRWHNPMRFSTAARRGEENAGPAPPAVCPLSRAAGLPFETPLLDENT